MIKFRVYFSDGSMMPVEAPNPNQARHVAADLAKQNGVFVTKVKRSRE